MPEEVTPEKVMPGEVVGTLELMDRGGGFLRTPKAQYRPRNTDVFVPVRLCKELRFRGGETIVGQATLSKNRNGKHKPPRQELANIATINGLSTDDHLDSTPFEELTAIDPLVQLRFETVGGPESMRVIDLLTPVGFGQRGLIVAPPRTGKTVLLQQMAAGIAANYPNTELIVLLVDERPEEVTDMRRTIKGEVMASSNDGTAADHIRLSRFATEKFKRSVEAGRDVVVLLDSLTRLGRAFNSGLRGGRRTMSGGLDNQALTEPKAIFGAARNVENGGSLTILATALIDTGSRMDEVIFNEFKGTGNMEIMLDCDMANRRLYPAIDLDQSGTRKEEKLLAPSAYEASIKWRRQLHGKGGVRAMEMLLESMRRHKDNDAFVKAASR